jgi:hypothetical protein
MLFQVWVLASIGLGCPLLAAACFISGSQLVAFMAYVVVFGVAVVIIDHLPVKCGTPGCNGRVHHMMSQVNCLKARLAYKCNECEYRIEKEFFKPNGSEYG